MISPAPNTSSPVRLLIIAGARPNFMKIAPLLKAIEAHNAQALASDRRFEYRLIHTGQHYDAQMSDVFFRELGIPAPDVSLDVGSGSHAVQTANIMIAFEPVLVSAFAQPSTGNAQPVLPDWVVVVGDVNSTLACTLVASKLGIKVAHVEAGLRSYDRTMPEEVNRIVTDCLADLLLTPSEEANENLRREGTPEHKIRLVGNIMIDSLVAHLGSSDGAILEKLSIPDRGFIYVTLHRPSNVDEKESLSVIVQELDRIAEQWPVVFPVHPRTRKQMQEFGLSFGDKPGLKLLDPIGYRDSIALTRHARCVLTDSGGLQEETTYFRTPCLTLRPNTERPITITLGSNRLTTTASLRADLEDSIRGEGRKGAIPPLWDGKTAERILEALVASGAK